MTAFNCLKRSMSFYRRYWMDKIDSISVFLERNHETFFLHISLPDSGTERHEINLTSWTGERFRLKFQQNVWMRSKQELRYTWVNVKKKQCIYLLPPANEVWGKVIFLHQFVILFTGGVCMVSPGGDAWLLWGGHAWLLRRGGMCDCSRGPCLVLFGGGACVVLFGGVCVVLFGGVCVVLFRGACVVLFGGACVVFSVFSDTMRYGQWAGGTHPTGMHSCCYCSCWVDKSIHPHCHGNWTGKSTEWTAAV